jgi:CheY-like chemotaxis protein
VRFVRASSNGLTVLVVEDDWLVRTDIVLAFQQEGWMVLEASTGDNSLKVLEGNTVDLLITDIGLADVMRAASRDRPAHGPRPRIRILFEPRSETAGHFRRRCAGVMQKGYFGANADEIAALAASSNAPSRAVCAIEPARPPRNRSVGALNLSTHTAAAKLTLRHSLAESQLFAHSRHSLSAVSAFETA